MQDEDDLTRLAEAWPSLSDADRSRLLQGMTTEEKRDLRLAIRRVLAHPLTPPTSPIQSRQ